MYRRIMERHLNKKARRSSHKNHIKETKKRTEEDSNSICINASWKQKKIIDEIAKTNDVELIDATQTVEKDLSLSQLSR